MMMKLICIVNGIRLQNPSPKLCAMVSGATPIPSAATVTAATAAIAKAKASGNQRSDHAQQRSATVDNLNQRAGGCSGGSGGLASCLFDGLAAQTLGLGPHAVSIVHHGRIPQK